jgi:hypothetical protein
VLGYGDVGLILGFSFGKSSPGATEAFAVVVGLAPKAKKDSLVCISKPFRLGLFSGGLPRVLFTCVSPGPQRKLTDWKEAVTCKI